MYVCGVLSFLQDVGEPRRLDATTLSECVDSLFATTEEAKPSVNPRAVLTLICGTRGYNSAAVGLVKDAKVSENVHVFE